MAMQNSGGADGRQTIMSPSVVKAHYTAGNNALNIYHIAEQFLWWGIDSMAHFNQFAGINGFQDSAVFLPV